MNFFQAVKPHACEQAIWKSKNGTQVRVRRYRRTTGIGEIEVCYGRGGIGRSLWWPDNLACLPQIAQALTCFLADENLSRKPFRRPKKSHKSRMAVSGLPKQESQTATSEPRSSSPGPRRRAIRGLGVETPYPAPNRPAGAE